MSAPRSPPFAIPWRLALEEPATESPLPRGWLWEGRWMSGAAPWWDGGTYRRGASRAVRVREGVTQVDRVATRDAAVQEGPPGDQVTAWAWPAGGPTEAAERGLRGGEDPLSAVLDRAVKESPEHGEIWKRELMRLRGQPTAR